MTTPTQSSRKPRPSKLDPYLHLLGVQSDAQVAALAGLTPEAVRLYRKRRGIPSARDAAAAAEEPLPPEPGEEPAAAAAPDARPGKSASATRARSAKGAKGKPKPTVEPPAPAAPAAPAGKRGPRSKLDAVRDQIGVLSDGDVAAMVGLTRSAVQMYRLKHGIAAAAPKGGRVKPRPEAPAPAAAPAAAPARAAAPSKAAKAAEAAPAAAPAPVAAPAPAPAAAGGPLVAWKLTLRVDAEEVVRFAVAADVASAARIGMAAGDVARIERLGEALG